MIEKELLDLIAKVDLKNLSPNEKNFIDQFCNSINLSNDYIELSDNLKQLLQQRWLAIKGTQESYCRNRLGIINQLCIQIASHLMPTAPHILLMPSLKGLTDLSDNRFELQDFYQFITTEDDEFFINLEDFFEFAREKITQAEQEAFCYINAEGVPTPLTEIEQNSVIALLPAAQEFFKRASSPKLYNSESMLNSLQKLRQGLLKADANHEGEELEAASSVYSPIIEFNEVYERLLPKQQTRLRSLRCNDKSKTLGYYLDALFKSGEKAKENGITYCIQLIGRNIEAIINQHRDELAGNNYSVEYLILKQQYQEIISQLKQTGLAALREYNLNYLLNLDSKSLNIINTQGENILFNAVRNGQLDAVIMLLETDSVFEEVNTRKYTPLLLAALHGHLEIVQELINAGCNINHLEQRNRSALHAAAQNGHAEIARVLVTEGCNINQTSYNGNTPLAIAIINGHVEVAKLLIEAKCDINKANKQGLSPLHLAAKRGNFELVCLLLKERCYVEQTSKAGKTPLDIAEKKEHHKIINVLKRYSSSYKQMISSLENYYDKRQGELVYARNNYNSFIAHFFKPVAGNSKHKLNAAYKVILLLQGVLSADNRLDDEEWQALSDGRLCKCINITEVQKLHKELVESHTPSRLIN